MYSNISSYLEFMGAVNFAFVITDHYNVTILDFLSFGPESVKRQIEIIEKKVDEIKLKGEVLETHVAQVLKDTERDLSTAKSDLNRAITTSSFSGISLMAGLHCILCLLIIGFEQPFKGERIQIFEFAYFVLFILFMLLFYSLDIEEYRFSTFKKSGAIIVFFFVVLAAILFTFFLKGYFFVKNETMLSILAVSIPALPLIIYFMHSFFYKSKHISSIGDQLRQTYLKIKDL